MRYQNQVSKFFNLYEVQRTEELFKDTKEILTTGASPELKEKMRKESQIFKKYQVESFLIVIAPIKVISIDYFDQTKTEDFKTEEISLQIFKAYLWEKEQDFIEKFRRPDKTFDWELVLSEIKPVIVVDFINYHFREQ